MDVTRSAALAFRIASQGLRREGPDEAAAVLDLGVQHHGHSVALATAARLPDPVGPGELAWTHRGAPHRHTPGSLQEWAARLRPLDEADAAARLNKAVPEALVAIDRTAAALAEVVTGPMTKGEVSTAVSRVLPREMQRDCAGCHAVHVHEQLMRLAALPAGITVDAGRTMLLTPPPAGWRHSEGPGTVEAVARLVTAAVAVLGPVSTADLGGWVGTSATTLRPAVEAADLAAVTVEGRRAWVTPDALDRLADPPAPPGLRLLPPFDPLLSGRDRKLLVPDDARRRLLWPALGQPGAVLVGTEIVGTWRPSASGTKLSLAVTAFDELRPDLLDDEAERVAAARGLRLAGVTVA
ncbi:DNA glycosylase AlkZ-like family protein [Actinomycetospora atypica]|uniref:DNA glycosylase AlkZ-like family protein n=1 Tax=Actinomycetospora atypica TaxID=1290095 RepID=A0ABV9YWF7_9PSEU